jgi:hypothetical protein
MARRHRVVTLSVRAFPTMSQPLDLRVLQLSTRVGLQHLQVWFTAAGNRVLWPASCDTLLRFASSPLHLHEVPTVSSAATRACN